MTVFDNLLTVFILVCLFLIIYLKVTNQTFVEFFRTLRDLLREEEE